MTVTINPPSTSGRSPSAHSRRWVAAVAAAVTVAAAGGIGIGLAVSSSGSGPSASSPASSYGFYQQTMSRYGALSGGMMGGSYGWMTGQGGYAWMMGGSSAPGWMAGGQLPEFMMGSNADVGEVMGQLFAEAPGPRVSPADAAQLATRIPPGASIDKGANTITFTGSNVAYSVVASPTGADDKFETAGLVNPTITVPVGARVSVQVVNADTTSAHGYVLTAPGASDSWMPMATAGALFPGAATWFLGDATGAGDHTATIAFTASPSGHYQYICPVPGHAQKGMAGTFVVTG